jgi:CheY-like chemotaxis protein
MNLCTNAYHAMDKTGGILFIELKKAEKKDILSNDKNYLELRIEDTGYGIPNDIIEKIFDPYFTTKDPGKGTGLGLAVVHGIIEDHEGFIKVSSITNKGSIFKIFLPATDKKTSSEKIEQAGQIPELGSGTIMVVDDEEVIVESTKHLLENFGYKVEKFSNGLDAFNEFSKNPSKYDVVVTDMTMPGLTGDNLASKIHELRPDLQVILCSGYSEKKADEKIAEKRSTIFLQKPFNINDLITLIKKAGTK